MLSFAKITDPQEWTRLQVHAWLQFTIKQFKLSPIQNIESIFMEDGAQLASLTELDFINRLPQVRIVFFFYLFIAFRHVLYLLLSVEYCRTGQL